MSLVDDPKREYLKAKHQARILAAIGKEKDRLNTTLKRRCYLIA